MSDRILGPSGSRRRRALGLAGGKRRRRVLLGVLASTVALVAFLVSYASAVHELEFQLDGDTDATTQTHVPTPPGTATQTIDWDSIFDANGADKSPFPANFGETSFKQDFSAPGGSFNTADTTTFTTGSKDTLDITPGWQCNRDNNVNSKIDIMNAYAVTYKDPATGDDLIYFALERNANTGTADVGFWFLKDGTVDCTSPGGATDFAGSHRDGDLLVVSEFTSGGHVSEIKAYKWVDPAGAPPGFLDTNPLDTGGDCDDNLDGTAPDDLCATVNTSTISTPWPTANKQDGAGNSLRVSEFFEGGVNLTDNGLGGACFNTFIADTRSSTSLTATLFDYARDRLGQCEATMTTQVSDAGPVTPGTAVHDTATVTGNKEVTPTGEVTFFLCGPIATGACTTGGTELTNVAPQGTLAPVPPNPPLNDASANSPNVNAGTAAAPNLSPGRYCFRAEWDGDTNYTTPLTHFGGANGTNECFTVQDTSSVATVQKWLPNDTATATLGSGGNAPSGTMVFTLFESVNCDPTSSTTTFTDSSPVNGVYETENTTYRVSAPAGVTTVNISWKATYTPPAGSGVTPSTGPCETSTLTVDNVFP